MHTPATTFSAVVLACVGLLRGAPRASAQEQVDVLDTCVHVEAHGYEGPLEIVNKCGVRIRVSWGSYNRAKDSGVMRFAKELHPGERVLSGYSEGEDLYAVGCPAATAPGHPHGYKLAYRGNVGTPVGAWEHVS